MRIVSIVQSVLLSLDAVLGLALSGCGSGDTTAPSGDAQPVSWSKAS